MYRHFFKRFFDFVLSLTVLLLIGWFLAFVALWLHFANKGAGAFFLQERPGKDARLFKIIKFKTMTDERDDDGRLLPDEQRLTRVGRFVRSTSIDELPQFINVLKGDMALIGPRPLLTQYLPLYTSEQMRRHEVRPGITGWAQVDNLSLSLDLKIIYLTIKKVVKRSNIGEGAGNMEEVDDLHFAERIKLN